MSFENPADTNTFWCCYLGCFGYGIGKLPACKPGDVICLGQGKMCCFKEEGKVTCGEFGGSEGFCFGRSQYCCLENGCQIIPTKPFVEFCGKRVWGAAKSGAVQDSGGRFGYSGDDEVACGIQDELHEAVKNQDFLRAHELKLRLAARTSSKLPVSISMS
mmetsp:Transcript_53592/g.111851  ORF Transcript_53592/g.111851 Transcript_53592/m.111851 type:complete len:160 (-) Transcript_53592:274-753(-)|eukprot:CAMPEP_0172179396 /NCGR_PEP_ID=MMETSP1050-20130122/16594_1 /TAXON_ID=233186 /ORGANISM="Cryptomonas curvata, Strain CCAP979/52" /LENGTH=159 /DNA_ID=CAMNT_0012852273 /DNA_START=36 /DNA_END=515 /DNA_ORIENTATION=+